MESQLKILKGPTPGELLPIPRGDSLLGRGGRATLRIPADSVSWEHAAITNTDDGCFIENLSSFGTLLNDNKLTGKTRLRPRDKIELAPDVTLQFLSGDDEGLLQNRTLLLTALAAIIATVILLIVFNPFATAERPANWNAAYSTLADFLTAQSAAGKLPPEAPQLFIDGYRLYKAQNYNASKDRWYKLQLLLNAKAPDFADNAAHDPHALDRLLKAPSSAATQSEQPSDTDLSADTAQFVARMLKFTAARSTASPL